MEFNICSFSLFIYLFGGCFSPLNFCYSNLRLLRRVVQLSKKEEMAVLLVRISDPKGKVKKWAEAS